MNTATMRILLSDASCGDNTDSPTHTESSILLYVLCEDG